MAFLDKLFRWKKKPFTEVGKEQKAKSKERELAAESSKPSALSPAPQGSGQYAHVLLRPHISEKAAGLEYMSQYVFEVNPSATKMEIMRAVKDLYGVAPEAVNIVNMRGKYTRFGRTSGSTRAWKKAMITLPEGKSIDVYKK